jgi:hypothetical protein
MKVKKRFLIFGVLVGVGAYIALSERAREKLTQNLLKLSETVVVKGKDVFNEYADRLLLAIKLGIEEAKRKEEDLERKLYTAKE